MCIIFPRELVIYQHTSFWTMNKTKYSLLYQIQICIDFLFFLSLILSLFFFLFPSFLTSLPVFSVSLILPPQWLVTHCMKPRKPENTWISYFVRCQLYKSIFQDWRSIFKFVFYIAVCISNYISYINKIISVEIHLRYEYSEFLSVSNALKPIFLF